MSGPLTELERGLLNFAGKTWRSPGRRDQAVREIFGVSGYRFHQLVLGLLDRPEALAYAPATVKRLTRLREQRARDRSIRSVG